MNIAVRCADCGKGLHEIVPARWARVGKMVTDEQGNSKLVHTTKCYRCAGIEYNYWVSCEKCHRVPTVGNHKKCGVCLYGNPDFARGGW